MTNAVPAATPLSVEAMTSGQLIRRARLIEAVLELVRDVGPAAVQMRDVAERSGIALGTAYRYFASKEHLMSVALFDWQERLTRRVIASELPPPASAEEVAERVKSYVRRELKGFQRNPEMAALLVQVLVSNDPYARDALVRMIAANDAVFRVLLVGMVPGGVVQTRMVVGAVLTNGLIEWVSGRASFAEMSRDTLSVLELFLANSGLYGI